jgi:hypothetical protein
LFAGNTNVLAGEAATDDIGNNSVCPKTVSGKGSHIVIAGDVGPVLFEDGSAIGLDFTEGDGSHPGSFEAKAKAANT